MMKSGLIRVQGTGDKSSVRFLLEFETSEHLKRILFRFNNTPHILVVAYDDNYTEYIARKTAQKKGKPSEREKRMSAAV